MSKKMFVAMNVSHKLTEAQIEDAKSSLRVIDFVFPSKGIHEKISNISPEMESREIRELALDLFSEAWEQGCDYVFIAGQPELVYYFLTKNKGSITAVNSVTSRVSIEVEKDGVVTKTNQFQHVLWREIL
jgi:hypothetical protein